MIAIRRIRNDDPDLDLLDDEFVAKAGDPIGGLHRSGDDKKTFGSLLVFAGLDPG